MFLRSLTLALFPLWTHGFASSGAVQSPQYPGDPMSPFSPKSPTSPNSPSRTLPRNFKSYHEASGINALMEQPSRYSMGGSHTLPKNYKSPVTSPLGSPTKTRDPLIDLPVSWTSAPKNCLYYIHVELKKFPQAKSAVNKCDRTVWYRLMMVKRKLLI